MNTLLENSYKGKNVLVTGHTGFKGSWLSIWLHKLGANVIGYSLDPYSERDNFVLSQIKDHITDIRGDIRNTDLVDNIFKKYKPEIVFHLAAQPIVRTSYEMPKYTFDTNVMGTVNVLDAVKSTDETKVGIIITSDKCYENKEWLWGYRENERLGGIDPYSCSKACAELIVDSYRNSFFNVDRYNEHGKVLTSVRAGNVIGGGDWAKDRIIPDTVNSLDNGREILVRNPNAIRPWQHVLDPLSGYLLLGAKLMEHGVEYSGAWNFGPKSDNIVTVQEIVEKIIKYWGSGHITYPENVSKLHEAKLLNLDISKAKHVLGWMPKWSIDDAIEKTSEWYKNYKEYDVYEMCVKQIMEHDELVEM
ncbi:MAG TPA: CDP-glucose 4,6-dehydratase [Clostridiales bacterium]|nr:MAG: CDP-glucose 4,6-dehydratase [Clostridiales bacterium GWD2_32_19]HCC08183.1 CDP-glucose 4,6-dehydratase [Clostridiales bacterium]